MAATPTYPEFTPGDGAAPPYLAGREAEQETLQGMLARIRRGVGAYSNVIIIGPRGNGKTALLRWFETECGRDNGVDTVWLTPDDILDLDALATELAPPSRWQTLLPDEAELGLEGAKLKWRLGNQISRLTRLLEARCKQRPLALLLDEAHTLDLKVGNSLLNTSQKVRAKAPFLLVLAGTPGLERQLNQMSATFWSRSKKLGLGRLDGEGARAALVEPFKQHRIVIEGPVLDDVIDESQRYPYFLQCWGSALVNVLQTFANSTGQAARQIDSAIVAAARPEFERERIGHYEIFRGQIAEAGLLPLAATVTRAYGDTDRLEEHMLDAAIGEALQATGAAAAAPTDVDIIKQRQALAELGYVWSSPDSADVWHAGVPSLMQHVLEIEEKKARYSAAAEEPASPATAL